MTHTDPRDYTYEKRWGAVNTALKPPIVFVEGVPFFTKKGVIVLYPDQWVEEDAFSYTYMRVPDSAPTVLMYERPEVEVLPGAGEACSGPHPQRIHADEIELMDDGR